MSDLKYDYTFQPDEPNNTAASVARFALTGGTDVLDVGSGPAWVSRYLAAEHERDVTCLDNDVTALRSAAGTGLRAIETDLEDDSWDAEIAGSSFDVVILADVLEHLREPQRLLERLLSAGLLRPDGILVISVPNASHQAVISELLLGDFRYTETGLLDETHVRWFTLRSLQRLLERAGYLVDRVERTTRILESTPSGERALDVPDSVRRSMKELNEDSEVYQYVVRAVVDSNSVRVARERKEFEDERHSWASEREQLRREAASLRGELERTSALLREERAAFAAEMELGVKELEVRDRNIARLRKRRDNLIRERDRARRVLDTSMYQESRGVRLAVRVVRRIRGLRGSS